MKTTITCTTIAFALLAGPALAAGTPDWSGSGNVSVVSDYVFRGITQTQGKATVQATVDLAHKNGAYVGAFASGVSWAAYNNGDKLEIDLYGGYKCPMGDANLDIGLVTYWFPGAQYTVGTRTIKYNTQELKVGYNAGAFNVTYWITPSNHWFGFAFNPVHGMYNKSTGSNYLEFNWNPEIMPNTVLNLHAGRQGIRHFKSYDFMDVKVGVTHTMDRWVLSAAATYNDGKSNRGATPYWRFFNKDGSYEYVAGSRFLVTAGYTF